MSLANDFTKSEVKKKQWKIPQVQVQSNNTIESYSNLRPNFTTPLLIHHETL
jgi:hypothetical protein